MVEEAQLDDDIECDSAGTLGYHAGSKADSRMRRAASKRGYDLQSRSRKIEPEDFNRFDLILTMDPENFHNVEKIRPEGEVRARLQPFCEHCSMDVHEVPDPYYGSGSKGFEYVMDILEDGCSGLLERVSEDLEL